MRGRALIANTCMTVQRSFAVASLCVALAACGRGATEPYYAHADCRRIDLTDEKTGARIVGAEDMAFDSNGGRLIISAYDRRATEKATKASASPPQGGVYAVGVDALFDTQGPLPVTALIEADKFKNGLRPHGLDFSEGRLAFINRGYVRKDGRWRMAPSLVRVSDAGTIASKHAHCAANDVAVVGDSFLATRDHAACGGLSRLLENALGQKKSGAYFDDGAALIDGIAFANGVTVLTDGFAVAATRENAVHIFRANTETGSRQFVADTPGAPDNLSVSLNGDIIAALHTNLIRLGLNRSFGIGKAGSRIARIDVETGEAKLLFDDPKAALFSAATVGVETDKGLVVGSVTDTGVLVCEKTK